MEEQRTILDSNVDSVDCMIKIWNKIKEAKEESLKNKINLTEFSKEFYKDLNIHQLRKLKSYLSAIKTNYSYVIY